MPARCVICKNFRDELSNRAMHRFPTELELKKAWIDALSLSNDFEYLKGIFLCSDHFKESDFKKLPSGARILKPNSVPSQTCLENQPDAKSSLLHSNVPDLNPSLMSYTSSASNSSILPSFKRRQEDLLSKVTKKAKEDSCTASETLLYHTKKPETFLGTSQKQSNDIASETIDGEKNIRTTQNLTSHVALVPLCTSIADTKTYAKNVCCYCKRSTTKQHVNTCARYDKLYPNSHASRSCDRLLLDKKNSETNEIEEEALILSVTNKELMQENYELKQSNKKLSEQIVILKRTIQKIKKKNDIYKMQYYQKGCNDVN